MPVPIRAPPPAIPAPAAAPKEDKEDIKDIISSLTIMESRPTLFFGNFNIAIAYPTGFFADGRKRLIFDILCQAQHRDYYRVVMRGAGMLFCLQARIPPAFLDITGWIENKLDVHNPDTMVVVAATRRTSNFFLSVYGSNFESMWTKGQEFPLAFKNLPNPHTQIIWHPGCPLLYHKRSLDLGRYLNGAHQQMPILRVTFMSLEVQRLAALHLDDNVIAMMPTRSPMGFGLPLAPPPPSSSSGGGGFGSGGGGFAGGGSFGGGGSCGGSCGVYGGGLIGGGGGGGIGSRDRGGGGSGTVVGSGSTLFAAVLTQTLSPQ